MGKLLDGYPTWCQLRDPEPSGSEDPFASTNCGEECCSIVQFALTGKYTTAGEVRQAMPGHEATGRTNASDIQRYLVSAAVGAEQTLLSPGQLKAEVKLGVELGRAAILLGTWVSASTMHWVLAIGYGNDHIVYVDPWYGELRCMHWADAVARFRGVVVRVWPKAPKNSR